MDVFNIILDELPQEFRQYINPIARHGWKAPLYLYRATSRSSSFLSQTASVLQRVYRSAPSDLTTIILLLVILYLSLRITGYLLNWVWSWVWMFGKLVVAATVVYFGVLIFNGGAGDVLNELEDWIAVLGDWIGGFEQKPARGGQRWR